jgi:hypothetical protein
MSGGLQRVTGMAARLKGNTMFKRDQKVELAMLGELYQPFL